MALVDLERYFSGNPDVDRLQDNLHKFVRGLLLTPFLSGVCVKDVEIATTDTIVEHSLGSSYSGFFPLKINAGSVIFESPTINTSKDRILVVRGTIVATADIWVF